MARYLKHIIFIDKNPDDLDQGWGWVEVKLSDVNRLAIPTMHPKQRLITKQQTINITRYQDGVPYVETSTEPYQTWIYPPHRGRAGGKSLP